MRRFRFTMTRRIPALRSRQGPQSANERADPTKCRTFPRNIVEVQTPVMEDRFIVSVGDQPTVACM
jgi:hypothetical protein